MKIICKKADLVKAVQTVSKAVPMKSSTTILECICTFRINGAPFPRQRCKEARTSGALSVCCYLLIGSISLMFLPFISKR